MAQPYIPEAYIQSSFQVLLFLLLANFALEEMFLTFLLAYGKQIYKFEHLENICMNVLRSGVKVKPKQVVQGMINKRPD